MEWKTPQRMDGGANGFYQDGEAGYCITFSVTKDDRAVFNASHHRVSIGVCYVDPRNKEMVREMGRVMRMMCGAHANIAAKDRK